MRHLSDFARFLAKQVLSQLSYTPTFSNCDYTTTKLCFSVLMTKELIRKVTDDAFYALDNRVGMYCCEFTQPQDYAPLGAGSFHGNLRRLAQVTEQRAELTEWVAQTAARERKAPASLGIT